MKIKVDLRQVFSDEEQKDISDEPQISNERIKTLTMNKIQNKKYRNYSFTHKYTKIASVVITLLLITSVSVFAFSNEEFPNFISQLIEINQTKVLVVGESVSNQDYLLKVHELVTDSYTGRVVVSVESISNKSKQEFSSHFMHFDCNGRGFAKSELEEYREESVKFYEISFSGAKDEQLQLAIQGMKKKIKVPLIPTVKFFDLVISENGANEYQYKINKLRLSEIGLTLEGVDTKSADNKYLYKAEILLTDGTKELIDLADTENHLDSSNNTLCDGGSGYHSGDLDNYINRSFTFAKSIPFETMKQIIINDIAYDIKH